MASVISLQLIICAGCYSSHPLDDRRPEIAWGGTPLPKNPILTCFDSASITDWLLELMKIDGNRCTGLN